MARSSVAERRPLKPDVAGSMPAAPTDELEEMMFDIDLSGLPEIDTLSDDPEKRAKAVELMGRRNPESV